MSLPQLPKGAEAPHQPKPEKTAPGLLIFDIDGTLCLTKEVGDSCFLDLYNEWYPGSGAVPDWENVPHVTDSGILQHLFHSWHRRMPTPEEALRFQQEYSRRMAGLVAQHQHRFKPVAGASEFLRKCRRMQMPIAIATGAWREIAVMKLDACRLDYGNAPLCTADDSHRRTEIVSLAIRAAQDAHGVKGFDEVTYFGDGLWDKKCCEELGIRFIGIDTEGNGRLALAGVQEVYKDFTSLEP